MIIATAGHVDHGKTTLIRTLTGVDTDRLEIEKQRGLSIELGFAYWNAPNGDRIGFVDVPGHARFLPTMTAGVGGIDAAILVVAADDGIMPQTREHIAVLGFLGVSQGVIAISKCDTVSEEKIADVKSEIIALLAGTAFSCAPVVVIDSLSEHGFDALRLALTSLMRQTRKTDAPARLSVDRAFLLKGVGLVATGTLLSGRITIGDTLTVTPSGFSARVRSLHAQNEKVDTALAGHRCAVNLTGPDINPGTVKRGSWLVENAGKSTTTRFDTEIHLAEGSPRLARRDLPVYLHVGAAKTTARLVLLDCRVLEPGGTALAQLVTDEPIDVVYNDRFVLRNHAGNGTIAGGRVLTPFGATKGRSKQARLQNLVARKADDIMNVLQSLLDLPPYCIDLAAFCIERNLHPSATVEFDGALDATMLTHGTETFLVNTQWWDKWSEQTMEDLSTFHNRSPFLPGLSKKDLLRTLGSDGPDAEVFRYLMDRLVAQNKVLHRNGVYSVHNFTPSLIPQDEAVWQQLKRLLELAGSQAPTVHEMSKDLTIEPNVLAAVLNRVAALGLVHHISKNRYLLPETLNHFETVASALGNTDTEGFAVTDFRDKAVIGRNLAIDVLEYMDRQGVTVRHGDHRLVRQSK